MTLDGPGRPGASPASTAPRSVTSSRATRPGLVPRRSARRRVWPAPTRRRTARMRAHRALPSPRPCPARGRRHVQVQAGAQVLGVDDDLVSGRHAVDDVGAVAPRPACPRASPARRPARGRRPRRGSKQTPGAQPAAAKQRAVQAPCRPQPTMPTVAASGAASARAATAATAPVRSAVTAACVQQRQRQGRCRASLMQTMPIHRGQPVGGRVAREGGDPLQHRQVGAAGGHRAEVAVGRAVEVDLGGHHPLAAVVVQERVADVVDRVGGAHRGAGRRRG